MTAENNGTGGPSESDDPFAHLYRQQGGGDGSTAAPQAGVPRRSYNQVRTVGERQYGGQYGGQQYGGGQQSYQGQQQGGYGQQPSPHYAAPETMPGGRAATRQGAAGDRGRGRDAGPSRNGLMIGAIAVVAAVVIGIGAAIYFNGDGGDDTAGGKSGQQSVSTGDEGKSGEQNQKGGAAGPKAGKLVGKEDAASLRLDGGATAANNVPNALGKNGEFVGSMNNEGAAATWTVANAPKTGLYTVFVRYGVPGKDAHSTLTVNGKRQSAPLSMKNFAGAKEGDWANGWTKTFAWVNLKKGQNDIKVSCEQGDECDFNLDQFWLKTGKVTK